MSTKCLRWGIVSAGKICHDFVCGIKVLPPSEHQVVAVAARNIDDAKKFAFEHGIAKSYGSYAEIANDTELDIVYIGAINTKHYEIAKLMIDAGKNVLCEKPLTMNKKQTESLMKHAHEKGVFFMEAIWSRSFPVYKKLAELIQSGMIGDVQVVNVNFGFPLEHVSRVSVKDQGGSGILDIGVYALQFAQYVYRGAKAISFTSTGFLNAQGVDNSASCIIQYENNKSAVLTINTTVELPNEAVAVGTKGTIRIPQFWCPTKLYLKDAPHFEAKLPESKDTFNFLNSVGLSYEAAECRQCILGGKKESPTVTHAESLQLAEQMDAWRKSVGVVYDADSQEYN